MSRRSQRPIWAEKPSVVVTVAKGVIIVCILLVILYPMATIVTTSLVGSTGELLYGVWPTVWSLDAYTLVLDGGVVSRAMLVSGAVTAVGTVLSTAVTAMLGYGLTRTRYAPGTRGILFLVLLTMMFSAGIIPNFLLVRSLGLLDNYLALILPVLVSAFNMLVMRTFFLGIPEELTDACRIDGASELRILWSLILPLSKPVIAVVALFYAVAYWNAFFNALIYLNDPTMWPIQLVLNQYVVQGSPLDQLQNDDATRIAPQAVQMAIVVIATLPILVVYPFVQRHFKNGALVGAIKG